MWDFGFRIADWGLRLPDVDSWQGLRIVECGLRIADLCFTIYDWDYVFGLPTSVFRLRSSDFGLRIGDCGLRMNDVLYRPGLH